MDKTMDNDTITVGELGVRFLIEAADSNGSASVFECHVPADSRMPLPTATTASRRRSTGSRAPRPGRSTAKLSTSRLARQCVSRGQIHGFENHSDVDATFLAIATPAVFAPAYFREIAEVLAASAGERPQSRRDR